MMKRWLLRITGFLLLAGLVVWALFPEEYVVRGPLLDRMLGRDPAVPTHEVVDLRLQAPPGYEVTLWAEGLGDARFMRFSPGGSLLLAQSRLGQIVHVLGDRDGDGFSDGHRVLVANLDRPHGIDFRGGHLYVGEGSAIARIAIRESGPDSITLAADPERIAEGIPEGGSHWRHSLRFGPDGGLYLTVGSTCNVCEEEDPRRATMLRYEPDGSGETIYATGLRNTVGFDWQPGTSHLYGTDNGRDLLGDDYPACELNRIERGGFYGWPYANANAEGATEPDPDLGEGHEAEIATTVPAAHAFRAHTAPLGIIFVRRPNADPVYRGAALVALHGSCHRSELDGYEIVSLHWDDEGSITERPFLTGFEVDGDVIGRPVDVAEGPDGAFYVSDDYGGAIYRVARAADAPPSGTRPVQRREGLRSRELAARAVRNPLDLIDAGSRQALEARGEALFAENACATCHLEASAAPGVTLKKLEGLALRYSVESLEAFLLTPQPPMPTVDLPADERRALAVHLLANYGE
jgi:glucose/arabinose dehydrogenase